VCWEVEEEEGCWEGWEEGAAAAAAGAAAVAFGGDPWWPFGFPAAPACRLSVGSSPDRERPSSPPVRGCIPPASCSCSFSFSFAHSCSFCSKSRIRLSPSSRSNCNGSSAALIFRSFSSSSLSLSRRRVSSKSAWILRASRRSSSALSVCAVMVVVTMLMRGVRNCASSRTPVTPAPARRRSSGARGKNLDFGQTELFVPPLRCATWRRDRIWTVEMGRVSAQTGVGLG
jgi:hypothetical protein